MNSHFLHRVRGEPDPKWLEDVPRQRPSQNEHALFAESCARIDARNRGLGKIIDILRETREELAIGNRNGRT